VPSDGDRKVRGRFEVAGLRGRARRSSGGRICAAKASGGAPAFWQERPLWALEGFRGFPWDPR